MVVQLDNQAIRSLDRCNLNVVALYITSAEVEYIRIALTSEALEEENITHTFERLLVGRDFELSETVEFVPSEKDDFLLGTLEFRLITIVGVVLMHTFLESPAQKPLQETQFAYQWSNCAFPLRHGDNPHSHSSLAHQRTQR